MLHSAEEEENGLEPVLSTAKGKQRKMEIDGKDYFRAVDEVMKFSCQ